MPFPFRLILVSLYSEISDHNPNHCHDHNGGQGCDTFDTLLRLPARCNSDTSRRDSSDSMTDEAIKLFLDARQKARSSSIASKKQGPKKPQRRGSTEEIDEELLVQFRQAGCEHRRSSITKRMPMRRNSNESSGNGEAVRPPRRRESIPCSDASEKTTASTHSAGTSSSKAMRDLSCNSEPLPYTAKYFTPMRNNSMSSVASTKSAASGSLGSSLLGRGIKKAPPNMFGGITGDVLSMLTMESSGRSDYASNAGGSSTQLEKDDEGNPVEKSMIEPTSCGSKGRAHDLIRHHSGSSSRSIPRDGTPACSY